MNFTRALATTSRRHVVGSNFTSIFAEQSVYASARRTPGN
jgi:hypothetical protein